MKVESISEISNTIFYPLKTWVEESTGNWNMLIGIGIVLLLVGVILTYVFRKKRVRLTKEQIKYLKKYPHYVVWSSFGRCDFPERIYVANFLLI